MAAEDVLTKLERFSVRTQGRLAPVARWLTAMVQLFQPQLRTLLHDRDAALKRFIDAHATHDRSAVLADRAIDVLSETPAHLPTRIAELIEQP